MNEKKKFFRLLDCTLRDGGYYNNWNFSKPEIQKYLNAISTTGIEYVDGAYKFSTVVTDVHSNWSVIELNGKPESIWIKAVRRIDAVEIELKKQLKK